MPLVSGTREIVSSLLNRLQKVINLHKFFLEPNQVLLFYTTIDLNFAPLPASKIIRQYITLKQTNFLDEHTFLS